MSQQNELRVFISSTFRDLQEEREHLVKKIFPEIRALCRERGVIFTEVDLRWGLTDEDVALGQVIRTCLGEVDTCRPYFIGITGDRYGYIPSHLDIYKDPVLLEQYPWIEDAANDQMSITEMEAQYAVLRNSVVSDGRSSARFYFRRHRESLEAATDSTDEGARLAAFQERIRAAGVTVSEFRDPSSLGEQIYDDLIRIIKRDFADAKPPTPLEEERSRHEAFSLSRRRAYIPNPAYLKHLNDHAASDAPPLVVYAESGSGKSSLFAFWAEGYRRKNPDAHVVEHYVGIGATSTDHYAIIRHICMEINARFGRDDEIPSEPAKLELALGQWLGYADHELTKRGQRMVLILDGLNQLQGSALNLRWIPDVISPSIRLILSSTVEGTLMELRKRGWSQFGMQALSEAERETIVVRYLAEYHKSLNSEQVKCIATDYKCGHPLFLKTVLEELRLVGRHEELGAKIESYLEATGTEDLFQRVLERLEEDYNMRAVRDVMTLLSASRSGLDERELSEISGIARLKIATMMAGLDYHLVKKEGRLTFFHDYLRRAVEKRYLSDESKQRSAHLRIAEYFQSGVTSSIASSGRVPLRMADELAYQLHRAGETDRLGACLSTLPVFLALHGGQRQNEVLGYWSSMAEGDTIEARYRRGLEDWDQEDAAERSVGMGRVAGLLERLGRWRGTIELQQERLASAIARGDRSEEAASRRSLGNLMQMRGENSEAMSELEQARNLCTELGDRRGLSHVIGNMGSVHWQQGRYAEAMECYGRQLAISEELGDRSGMSRAIGNMGSVHADQGQYAEAIECYGRKFAICEELGDRYGMSRAIGNMGVVHWQQGRYAEAIECYGRQLAIGEEQGDRYGMSVAIGNMGVVHFDQGRYAEAMECHGRKLAICEELGDRREMSRAIGNMGSVHWQQGRYAEAMECFGHWRAISEELGDRSGMSLAIGNMGSVHHKQGRYAEAMECYGRRLAICEELGDRSGMFFAIGSMGAVHSDQGRYAEALRCYRDALDGHRAIGNLPGVISWLEGWGHVLVELAGREQQMPEYLPDYIPEATETTWHAMSLQKAREDAEESITISEEISKPDTIFRGSLLLARVDAAEGKRDQGCSTLRGMLDEATEDEQRAELHYWLWKLADTNDDERSEALRLYQQLVEKTPKHEHEKRIEELAADVIKSEVTDAP